VRYLWSTASHPGRARPINEDAVYPADAGTGDNVLLVVADGLGGHIGGEVASRLAIEVASDAELTPAEAVLSANRAILAEVANRPRLAGMATTMTLARLDQAGSAHFAHVGDSRGYLLRHGELRRLTKDHSVVAEYIASGQLTEKEAENHPQRSLVTRALGLEFQLEVDEFEEPLEQSDRLLLCSDGLTVMIDDDHIRRLLGAGTPEEAVWALVEAANTAGGHDNITVAIADALE
jgi:protein phosphatase